MRPWLRSLTLILIFSVAAPAAVRAAASHLFSVHDMVAFDRLSEPQVSPDGRWIVFSVSVADLEANKRRSDLHLVKADGTGLRRLTSHEAGDSAPRWSADGRSVWFLSSRSGTSQVWRIPVDGGEAEQATHLPLDVNAFLPSPDGAKLAVALEVFPDCVTLECTTKRLDEIAGRKSTGQIFDHLFIRHWDAWSDGRRSHLFVLPAAGGSPVDVMRGMDADSPSKPFGGTEEFSFTPDGKAILFSARDAGREEAWSTNFDLFLSPADGSGLPKRITDSQAWDTQPAFSPDGKTLAYLAMARPGYEADRYAIVLRPWPGGRDRILTGDWDRSPQTLVWSRDGRTLYATAENLGQASLFAVDAFSGKVRTIVKEGTLSNPSPAGPRLVYLADDLNHPAELFSVSPGGGDVRAVTKMNAAKVAATRMGHAEQFSFKGANDDTVYGYAMKPADFREGRKYPVAFLIHGGPQGSFGNHFHYRWNPQAYAGAGYASVMIDFHGSTGYGQAFSDAIGGDWGGKPLVDLQKGLDAALARYPWLDANRVSALGASYGAYMVNWIEGNWPDRFRCLVSHDGNLDERMAYFDTEELWFPEWDHRGTPWDNPESYERQNPVNFVKSWKTPMLVVHGGKDYRIVYSQGISVFTALQRRGIPSKFLYFPDENHWVLKPQNSILWHDTVIAWLDQWTKAPR
jgi:dipeptidyl aminopeptidase/acylaminoacyl peptidase